MEKISNLQFSQFRKKGKRGVMNNGATSLSARYYTSTQSQKAGQTNTTAWFYTSSSTYSSLYQTNEFMSENQNQESFSQKRREAFTFHKKKEGKNQQISLCSLSSKTQSNCKASEYLSFDNNLKFPQWREGAGSPILKPTQKLKKIPARMIKNNENIECLEGNSQIQKNQKIDNSRNLQNSRICLTERKQHKFGESCSSYYKKLIDLDEQQQQFQNRQNISHYSQADSVLTVDNVVVYDQNLSNKSIRSLHKSPSQFQSSFISRLQQSTLPPPPQILLQDRNKMSNNFTEDCQTNLNSLNNTLKTQYNSLINQKEVVPLIKMAISPKQIEIIVKQEINDKRQHKQQEIFDLVKKVEENIIDSPLNDKKYQESKDQKGTLQNGPRTKKQNPLGVNQARMKEKTRSSLIKELVSQKSKRSIAVMKDILKINDVSLNLESQQSSDEKYFDSEEEKQTNSQNRKDLICPPILNEKGGTIRKALKDALIFLKRISITPRELIANPVFSHKPFEKKLSREFITASKKGDISTIKDLLFDNRYLVHDFDFVHWTALHWAVKRSHIDIIKHLLLKGADIDSKDLIGRTPLFIAIQNGDNQVAELLLENRASPWSNGANDFNQASQKNQKMMQLLSKFRKLYIVTNMCKPNQRDIFWKRHVGLLQSQSN